MLLFTHHLADTISSPYFISCCQVRYLFHPLAPPERSSYNPYCSSSLVAFNATPHNGEKSTHHKQRKSRPSGLPLIKGGGHSLREKYLVMVLRHSFSLTYPTSGSQNYRSCNMEIYFNKHSTQTRLSVRN